MPRARIHDPMVLFLDEPTANLDPESSKMVREFVLELKKERGTIFINTHNLDEAKQSVQPRAGRHFNRTAAIAGIDQERVRHHPAHLRTFIFE